MEAKGIPLDESWLVEFNWKCEDKNPRIKTYPNGSTWTLGDYKLFQYDARYWTLLKHDTPLRQFYDVNTLQNLYYYLEGKEL